MERLQTLFSECIKAVTAEQVDFELTRPDPSFGDFASSVALHLSKKIGKSPREVAELLATELIKYPEFSTVEVAGPGFINIRVSDELLTELAAPINPSSYADLKIVIETNNPNPFKAMHIGHAFNAILAESIANLLQAGGAEVHRVSYHGDVGAHVGKSMYSILRFVDGEPAKLNDIKPQERNTFMSKMYAEGSAAYKNDEQARKEIDQLTAQSFLLEDSTYKEVYQICKLWSFAQIDDLVTRLGNAPIEKRYLESEADALGVKTVQAHVDDVFIKSDGALVFPGSKYGSFDNVFVSSNGRGLYGARDLGLIQLKNNDFHAQKSFIVTAEEQRDYFKGVIKAAELCLQDLKDVTVNIPTGTVKLTTGKMSSRNGEVVEVEWLFDQIAHSIIERGSEPDANVMTGAMRYQFLKVRIGSDVIFDINEAASLHGNSGPYLQYAHARACSVLAKATQDPAKLSELKKEEHGLLLKISEFNEVLERAVQELMPHYICNYLYELTQSFNRFYEHNRVIGNEREAVRVALLSTYKDTLHRGLEILGIPAPEKM